MIKGGPKIIDDNLVVCLDAHDAKSYAGESTTNVVTYTNLNTGWSKVYQSNITYDEIDPPDGITSQVVGHTRGSNSGYWYSYGDYAPQVPNTVYTVSMYVKTLDSNFSIRFYTADNSETGRVWGSSITVPNDGKWHRIVWNSFTNPSNSQSDSLSFNFFYAGAIDAASTKTWFCAPQMEAKSYQTPFVAGSRSATNGWVDRTTNNNDGTLVNGVNTGVSHYRDGQVIMPVANSYLDFDGTNDYITISSLLNQEAINGSTTKTIILWLKADSYGAKMPFSTGQNGNDRIYYWTQNSLNTWRIGDYTSTSGHSTLPSAGTWFCTAIVINGLSVTGYLNGTQDYTGAYSAFTTHEYAVLGRHGTGSYYYDGKIGKVSVYNNALTAAEVLSNYNATKNRFT
jgi:hypothetical protein